MSGAEGCTGIDCPLWDDMSSTKPGDKDYEKVVALCTNAGSCVGGTIRLSGVLDILDEGDF